MQFSDNFCEIKSSQSSMNRDEEACSFLDDDCRTSCSDTEREVSFRSIRPYDRDEIQRLHELWFPVLYHDEFYDDLVQGRPGQFGEPLYSCLAVRQVRKTPTASHEKGDEIIASVVGTFVPASSLPESLRTMLLSDEKYTTLFYLMTLGCRQEHRNEGWASKLVQQSLQNAMRDPSVGCLYLHVLTTNDAAIRLYERLGFYRVKELVNYYSIDGKRYNCYLYAKYVNGNRGHLGLMMIVSQAFATLWKNLIAAPINFFFEVAGASNNSRLI